VLNGSELNLERASVLARVLALALARLPAATAAASAAAAEHHSENEEDEEADAVVVSAVRHVLLHVLLAREVLYDPGVALGRELGVVLLEAGTGAGLGLTVLLHVGSAGRVGEHGGGELVHCLLASSRPVAALAAHALHG
jgi:hypothetical protein